jgi:SAM-dependent methyltransferase
MTIESILENEVIQDAASVWVLKGHTQFEYSDGAESERYLREVLSAVGDLGTRSAELQSCIKDWPSEYHLSRRRSQLLAGFEFDRTMKVLEVGCGCGAITRQLGEAFEDVVSVEGSIARARLARLRTRDLPGVTIICAPFQDIRFTRKFDAIVCIGVYEYSASFVSGANPYDAVLQWFSDLLAPGGVLILAIENQFGLKYITSCREDHLGSRFAGLEGYHRQPRRVRTFGRVELERNLKQHFPNVRFYYPYPDYKMPDCVIGEEFLSGGLAGELVSRMKARDYYGALPPLMDEVSVSLELARNDCLPFFANSFLVVAGKQDTERVRFNQLAVLYSSPREPRFETVTKVVREADGSVMAHKTLCGASSAIEDGPVRLSATTSKWRADHSLYTEVYLRCLNREAREREIFSPCKAWVDFLRQASTEVNGESLVRGEYIDCIWSNFYPGSGNPAFIDREWTWRNSIPLNVLAIRAIYQFLLLLGDAAPPVVARWPRSGKRLIARIADILGLRLEARDFQRFVRLECELQSIVRGFDASRHGIVLRWFLLDRHSLNMFLRARARARGRGARVLARVLRMARFPSRWRSDLRKAAPT